MNYFLGLGTNIGDLQENLNSAIEFIKGISGISIVKSSSVYKTKPWGFKEQSDFLNMVIMLQFGESPEVLMHHLREIETKMGKAVLCKWGPRVIDIDILFCDDLIFDTEHLTIPHPEMYKRDFVLLPMMEIAPEFVHPIFKLTIEELYDNFVAEC